MSERGHSMSMGFWEWFNLRKKSVRSNVLKKLLFIYFYYFWDPYSEQTDELFRRPENRHVYRDKCNIAYALSEEDIMKRLGCSKRTAREYLDTLRILFL